MRNAGVDVLLDALDDLVHAADQIARGVVCRVAALHRRLRERDAVAVQLRVLELFKCFLVRLAHANAELRRDVDLVEGTASLFAGSLNRDRPSLFFVQTAHIDKPLRDG